MVHKQKVGFSSEMYGLSGLDKEKGNLLIHVGSISKKIRMNMKEDIQLTSNMILLPALELHRLSNLALGENKFSPALETSRESQANVAG